MKEYIKKKHVIIILPLPWVLDTHQFDADHNSSTDKILSLSPLYKHLPLGPLYLAESLIKQNFLVSIFDGSVESITNSVKMNFSDKTVAFAISSMSGTQLKNSISIAKELKEKYPNIPVILGGAHSTALPLQTLEADYIDYVVWGEGEISLPLLINSICLKNDPSKIKGIGFKTNGKAIITGKSDYTPLNRIFNLPYHLLDMTEYSRKLIIGPQKNYAVFSSRGCPFNCHFCSNSSSIWPNNRMRYHTTEHIINDISVLVDEYDADGINFGDENFFINQARLIEVCNTLIQNGFNKKVKFRGQGRADFFSNMPSHIWELLKEAGFIALGVGIESGSQRVLDIMGKGITLDQIYKTDQKLTEYNFYKSYNFMTCVPGESIEDINHTLRLIIDLARTSKYCPYPFGGVAKYTPLPGTKLFDVVVKEYGFKSPTTLEGWDILDTNNPNISNTTIRPWLSEQMLKYADDAEQQIRDLNTLFVGKDRDDKQIETQIEKISQFISSGDNFNKIGAEP